MGSAMRMDHAKCVKMLSTISGEKQWLLVLWNIVPCDNLSFLKKTNKKNPQHFKHLCIFTFLTKYMCKILLSLIRKWLAFGQILVRGSGEQKNISAPTTVTLPTYDVYWAILKRKWKYAFISDNIGFSLK